MSDHIGTILGYLLIALVLSDVVVAVRYSHEAFWKWHNNFWCPTYVTLCFLIALLNVIERRWFLVGLYSLFAVLVGYGWWNDPENRRRRKKLLERAWGKVVDLGGKLKVVNPAGASA